LFNTQNLLQDYTLGASHGLTEVSISRSGTRFASMGNFT